jgi:hypothetical protein
VPAPQAVQRPRRHFIDPGTDARGRYLLVVERGVETLAIAPRDHQVAILVQGSPRAGTWPERLEAVAARLAPGWRALLLKAVARPEIDQVAAELSTWIFVGATDAAFRTLHIVSDGATTVLALVPEVRREVRPAPAPPNGLLAAPAARCWQTRDGRFLVEDWPDQDRTYARPFRNPAGERCATGRVYHLHDATGALLETFRGTCWFDQEVAGQDELVVVGSALHRWVCEAIDGGPAEPTRDVIVLEGLQEVATGELPFDLASLVRRR